MHEVIEHAHDVVLIALVALGVEHVEDADLHVRLMEVCRVILDHLHSRLSASALLPTTHHLPERSAAQSVPNLELAASSAVGSEYVVDADDELLVLVVVAAVPGGFARLGQHPPRVQMAGVLEPGVALLVRVRQVHARAGDDLRWGFEDEGGSGGGHDGSARGGVRGGLRPGPRKKPRARGDDAAREKSDSVRARAGPRARSWRRRSRNRGRRGERRTLDPPGLVPGDAGAALRAARCFACRFCSSLNATNAPPPLSGGSAVIVTSIATLGQSPPSTLVPPRTLAGAETPGPALADAGRRSLSGRTGRPILRSKNEEDEQVSNSRREAAGAVERPRFAVCREDGRSCAQRRLSTASRAIRT